MNKIILTFILLIILLPNNAYEQKEILVLNKQIVSDLILIRNTYNWINNDEIRREMIRRQNKLISINERYLYEEYLIKEY